MATLLKLLLLIVFLKKTIGGIVVGPHLQGFADYVQSYGGAQCAQNGVIDWTCTNVDGQAGLQMDVISAAIFTQERHLVNVTNAPALFSPGFGLPSILPKMEPVRHLFRYPKNATEQHLDFHLHWNFADQNGMAQAANLHLGFNDIAQGHHILSEARLHIYLIHDFADSPATGQMETLRVAFEDLFLQSQSQFRYVIITVHWGAGAQYNPTLAQLNADGVYEMAVLNAMVVGSMLCEFFIRVEDLEDHQAQVVGVGLGAQVAHFAGEQLNRRGSEYSFAQIFGLDPPAHHFQGFERQYINSNFTVRPYLNANDAAVVTVIHTSAIAGPEVLEDDIAQGRMGSSFASEGIDFYPNGGSRQPMCVLNPGLLCDHNAALQYFIEGIDQLANAATFRSFAATTYAEYIAGNFLNIPHTQIQQQAYMSYSIASHALARNGLYFNHYRGLPVGQVQAQQPVAYHPYIFKRLVQPINFPRFDDSVSNADPSLLLGDEATNDCGMYTIHRPNDSARIQHGTHAYPGGFPWSVCIYGRHHSILPMDVDSLGNYRPPDERHSEAFIVPNGDIKAYLNKTYFYPKGFGRFEDTRQARCTGTVIDSRHIITAAHCFTDLANGQDVMLAFGGTSCHNPVVKKRLIIEKRIDGCYSNAQNPRNRVKCKRNVFLHPDYSHAIDTAPNTTPARNIPDIAVVRIPGDALDLSQVPWRTGKPQGTPFINSICYLSSKSFADGGLYDNLVPPQHVYVAGYGLKGIQERSAIKNKPMKLTFIKQRVGSGYLFGNDEYSVPAQPPAAGIFYVADDSVDTNGRWNGRDAGSGDSGATYYWFVKRPRRNVPDWVADTKVVAIGLVRAGPEEGQHIRDDTFDPLLPLGDAVFPGDGQRLAGLLNFIKYVQAETKTITSDPPDFLWQFK